ncbi:hypothetical protein Naga_101050g1 [Nannochloropsis gaditana]|uniref:Uncharacterized protein n=1 Tax=Nannochloropsis gaditana TaxID=72520 RepID=W7TZV9_9STRA|nr:hypothetical protein Naga_101050g1 [Nannochloropsis gaditana]
MLNGALQADRPSLRTAWEEEVRAAKTLAGFALCLYAFLRRARALLPEIKRRVKGIRQQEIAAKHSILANVEAGAVNLPTRETATVVWARLPRGPYWPALAHLPHHAGLRKLLKGMGHRMIRFIGEVGVYHLRTEMPLLPGLPPPATGGNAPSVLPFVDGEGRSSVDVLKKGRSLAKSLKVAWQLHEKFTQEGRKEEEEEEVGPGGVEEWLMDLEDEEVSSDEATESEEEKGRGWGGGNGRGKRRLRSTGKGESGASGSEQGGRREGRRSRRRRS